MDQPNPADDNKAEAPSHSLLDYAKVELLELLGGRAPHDTSSSSSSTSRNDEVEAISEFFRVPFRYERFVLFVLLMCFDGFLYNLSYLPFRAVRGVFLLFLDASLHISSGFVRPIASANLYDVCISLVMVITTVVLFNARIQEQEAKVCYSVLLRSSSLMRRLFSPPLPLYAVPGAQRQQPHRTGRIDIHDGRHRRLARPVRRHRPGRPQQVQQPRFDAPRGERHSRQGTLTNAPRRP